MNKAKRVIILEHGGGELSNQLWNFIGVYAHCLSRGYQCVNYSFFEYAPWFRVPIGNPFVYAFFFAPFLLLDKLGGYRSIKASIPFRVLKKIMRFAYGVFCRTVKAAHPRSIVSSADGVVHLDAPNALDSVLERGDVAYCTGWLFRNPSGVMRHRAAVRAYLNPRRAYQEQAVAFVGALRKTYAHVVGVHIRQRNPWDTPLSEQEDRASWESYDAKPFFYPSHFGFINAFLKEYCGATNKDLSQTCFVVCSNGPVSERDFPGFHCAFRRGNLIEDLLTLAACDSIVGSNSTLSAFASWWGDIPFVVMQARPDWGYYEGKRGYFENKHVSAVHY